MTAGTNLYVRILRMLIRRRAATIAVFVAGLALTVVVYRVVPTAFVPAEDQNFIICQVQAPEGASLEYTAGVAGHAERILLDTPEIAGVFSVMGFSFGGAAPNRGLIFIRLKPIGERPAREQSAMAVVGRLRAQFGGITEAIVMPFLPPTIPGLGALGGFQFQLLDQSGGGIDRMAQVARDLIAAANARPELRGIFTNFTASDPQLVVDIDRERVKSLDMPLDEVSSALQIFLGSQYVNDFDFNNRSYRVYVQADQRFRGDAAQLGQFYARSRSGEMLPLDNLVRVTEATSPQVIPHFNLFRSVEINGSAAPGVSSGEALRAMQEVAEATLPTGYTFAWSGQSREELEAGRQSLLLFGLGLLLVYLVLAAQYESYVLPFIILLAVPLAVLGALSAVGLRGLANDVYCQIGMVMLIGLAAKNSILIVEFAEQLRERGLSIIEAAIESSRIRLRPVLMTSLTLMLAVLPLVFASGAGQAGRHSVGTTLFGGMAFATFLNVIFIPVLYVVVRSLVPGRAEARSAAAVDSTGDAALHGAPGA